MAKPHVLVIPYPAQGHVIPLMEIAQCLVKHDIKVTFVNSEFIHKRVVNAMSQTDYLPELMQLVAIPDGLEPWEDRSDIGKMMKSVLEVMPGKLEALIKEINASQGEKITSVLTDASNGWPIEVANKLGLKKAALIPSSTAIFAIGDQFKDLIADGIIDYKGKLMKDQLVTLIPDLPAMRTRDLFWYSAGSELAQYFLFETVTIATKALKLADRVLCNSSYDLEPGAFSLLPKVKPIGPLLASNRLGQTVGHFWPADSSCLKWLDQQQENSVIYVAFGSHTIFDQTQFQEAALGLELTNKPFLWVVRQDIIDDADKAYPEGFKERVGDRGLIVSWTPQQQVLSHPSIACFISHCGWNSTMEGIGNGVPFLCWPYFVDQFLDRSYICDVWKVGLGLDKDQNGIIRRGEIKNKVEQLLDDGKFKAKALDLQQKMTSCVREGGSSCENFYDFISWVKDQI